MKGYDGCSGAMSEELESGCPIVVGPLDCVSSSFGSDFSALLEQPIPVLSLSLLTLSIRSLLFYLF